MRQRVAVVMFLVLGGCGGGKPQAASGASESGAAAGDPAATYAPLDVGADYRSFARVNKSSFVSPTHGGRFVDIYVNPVGLAAYQGEGELPVGSIVVKTSWETRDGKATEVAGPIFVMQKREKGFAPEHDDWWYGLHWESVPEEWVARMGGATQVYWRSPSKKADYCWSCHESYDRNLGMPPAEQRAWAAPAAAP
jgi:hypothetical protein